MARRSETRSESEVREDLASCYVEDDTAEINESIERETRLMQRNWIPLGNGGFFTRPAALSDFV
jgi:hypothetical protein